MNVNFNGNNFSNYEKPAKKPSTDKAPKQVLDHDTCAFKHTRSGKEKVNVLRIWFHRLTKEQIAQINATGKLPDNMKIRPNTQGTGYYTAHNIFGLTNGTKTVPEGYEFRQLKASG